MQKIDSSSKEQMSDSRRWRAPGTCGELVQGELSGRDFLVNCPIDLFSYATICPPTRPGLVVEDGEHFTKIREVFGKIARDYGLERAVSIRVESRIPRGKGMASSTADVSSALEALCRSCGVALSPEAFARVITAIEPSDCTHFPGIAHVEHLSGELVEVLPVVDGLRVLVVDCGGEVDTVAFDRDRARAIYRRNQPVVAGALRLLKRGLYTGDPGRVAEAATASTRLSQQILPKPPLEELLAITRELGALGVNCAHSGTVLGVLYLEDDHRRDALLTRIERHFGSDLGVIGDFRIIAGGCHEC